MKADTSVGLSARKCKVAESELAKSGGDPYFFPQSPQAHSPQTPAGGDIGIFSHLKEGPGNQPAPSGERCAIPAPRHYAKDFTSVILFSVWDGTE